ncbi:MAG: DUF4450 domain-containing protein [Rikenellaceae bacterium]|nr:DUF4450 domain-containing protein [Rikenellaceae bacterium]
MIRTRLFLSGLLLWTLTATAQQPQTPQLNEDYTFNKTTFAPRALHYRPDGQSAICVDGTARFNRALYGAHTGFRLECSDRPEFGIYLPGMGGNLQLTLPNGPCTARYTAGRMDYKQGGVTIEAQVLREGEDGALWRLKNTTQKPIEIGVRFGGVSGKKFYRNGDLGVDDPDCFSLKEEYCTNNNYTQEKGLIRVGYEAKVKGEVTLIIPLEDQQVTSTPILEGKLQLPAKGELLLAYFPRHEKYHSQEALQGLIAKAEKQREALAASLSIETPDPYLNPVAGALALAADGIWSGRTWLHGSIGWRTEHLGWRGAYVGSALGWHDRARTHFRTYAANQVTDIEPRYDHPRQDSTLNLARAEKKWGTPMYSNGYICRRPGKREMSHYDMNLVYIDALLRHIRATGDVDFMREMFPVIKRHLAWEKRNFDPDGDFLYDSYCAIWASDALYYNGGGVAHSSAYNYFANSEAARIAELIGEDPTPYRAEAFSIDRAMFDYLWDSYGVYWAEFYDKMGHPRLHLSPALWTIYHTIDSEINTPLEAAGTARYVQRELPHLPVRSTDFEEEYLLPATSDWQPYIWSINNVAVAEVMHAALAYWQAGMNEEAYHLMKGIVLDNMYLGTSPLNFGQISYLDAARGECYRDFADPIGVWSRALTEGLYGIRPDMLAGKVTLQPGFPEAWDHASIRHNDLSYSFRRKAGKALYEIESRYPSETTIDLVINGSRVNEVKVNGRKVAYEEVAESYGKPRIRIPLQGDSRYRVEIRLHKQAPAIEYADGPQGFRKAIQNNLAFYEALPIEPVHKPVSGEFEIAKTSYRPLDISTAYNASVNEIYRNEYLAPRPRVTTLQIPKQGYGDWCHPKAMAEIDDKGLRDTLRRHAINDRQGILVRHEIPMQLAHTGHNVAYTSLWENYPTAIELPLAGHGRRLILVMVGSTNHMQSHIANARLTVSYTDGTTTQLELVNPDNWASIEQVGINDGYSYRAPALWRLGLQNTILSRTLDRDMGIEGINRMIPGGAATLVPMAIERDKELSSLRLEALSNDVVVGIMGVTVEE